MHRALLSLLVTVSFAATANAQTFLDMSVNPVSVGWDLIDEGSGATSSVSGGILQIDSPLTAFHGYRAPMADWETAVLTGEWVVEARIHLIEQANTNNPDRGALHIVAADAMHYFPLIIHEDKISFLLGAGSGPYSGTSTYSMDTTDGFHTYRMEISGPLVEVYVDGVLVMSPINTGSSLGQVFAFGDLFYENSSSSEWDYVSFEGTSVVSSDEASWSELKQRYEGSNR